MTTADQPTTIHGAVSKAIGLIKSVPKSGTNTYFNYKYATDADIMGSCREAMAEVGLTVTLHEVVDRTVERRQGERKQEASFVTACYVFRVAWGGGEDYIDVPVWSGGQDAGEKADFKAVTGAKKYAYLIIFALATEDAANPEHDGGNSNNDRELNDLRDQLNKFERTAIDREKMIERIYVLRSDRFAPTPSEFFKAEIEGLWKCDNDGLDAYGRAVSAGCLHATYREWIKLLRDFFVPDDAARNAMEAWSLSAYSDMKAMPQVEAAKWLAHINKKGPSVVFPAGEDAGKDAGKGSNDDGKGAKTTGKAPGKDVK